MQVLIVGAGKLGYKVAEAFANGDHSVIVIDTDEQALERISLNLDVLTIRGNAIQTEVLKQSDPKSIDLAIAVTGSDETNMVICMLVKSLGCRATIARVRNPEYGRQQEFLKQELSIDYIVNPEFETAKYISKQLMKGSTVAIEAFAGGKVGMIELPVKNIPQLGGSRLRELRIFNSILVAAVSREGEMFIPHGDTILENSDIIYLFGERASLNQFLTEHVEQSEKRLLKDVMILGGGRAGFYLAQRLKQQGIGVKIIEQDEEQCQYLVENLQNVLVIHGDGTDSDLLREENFAKMDALITLTGNDEENLLLALLGKQQGIPLVIAKISRSNFIPIIEQLGIDRAVNPVLISAGEIIRYVQGDQIASLALLLDGQAEVVEIIVEEGTGVIGRSLAELELPKGVIIGAIVRDDQVLIPNGSSEIAAQDRAVVFCLSSHLPILDKLFYRRKGGLFHGLWRSSKSSGKRS
ncbi:MAG: Trk system potassium transporter TrkA [Candidatus Wallacebacter cryptica]